MMPMKRGFDLVTVTTVRSRTRSYQMVVWKQPTHRWLIAQIYHFYDMWIWKVPGFMTLEKWLQGRHRGDDYYLPLSAQQDCKCFDLIEKQRIELARVAIDEDLYIALGGKYAPSRT